MKTIKIGAKPTSIPGYKSVDDWVDGRKSTEEKMKRLTIDVPLSLHQRMKSQCALRGEFIADVVRDFLEQRFKPE